MTQVDDSLILSKPTSGFFTGTVNTEDRPTMTGLDRMEIIFVIILLIFSTSSKQLL